MTGHSPTISHSFDGANGVFRTDPPGETSRPIHLTVPGTFARCLEQLEPAARAWVQDHGLKPGARKAQPYPDANGRLAGLVVAAGDRIADDPTSRPELALGLAAAQAPLGTYHLAETNVDVELAAVAFGLGAYRFQHYKTGLERARKAQLHLPTGVDQSRVAALVDACWFGRDLINTPSNDLGPVELERAARSLAMLHGADITGIVGDNLIAGNFPLIHAVGRASAREPRLVDIVWGRRDAPKVTLVGKGICFDTGGLDLKTASGMLLMKKDMGGSATALALGHMFMATQLDVRLRILLAIAENSVSGNAFRPGDVITSRAGLTVEIGNTDAEGRLVLADALSLADDDEPDILASFATLTGAARVALGPDLPPMYASNGRLREAIVDGGATVADPVWPMPFWPGYETMLDSAVADLNNVSEGPFAGSIIAALFLKRFVKRTRDFVHFDIYGWRPAAKPLGPKGGEVQGARALFSALEQRYRTRAS
jgi:leucyl aminopeptidase